MRTSSAPHPRPGRTRRPLRSSGLLSRETPRTSPRSPVDRGRDVRASVREGPQVAWPQDAWFSIAPVRHRCRNPGLGSDRFQRCQPVLPEEFGITGEGRNEWIVGAINSIIFLTAGCMYASSSPFTSTELTKQWRMDRRPAEPLFRTTRRNLYHRGLLDSHAHRFRLYNTHGKSSSPSDSSWASESEPKTPQSPSSPLS